MFAINGLANYGLLRLRGTRHRPQIAAVVVGRNDDYMLDFRDRLHATVAWNIQHLVNEVVFVEWNPPGDRQLLSYDLASNFACLRAYIVPSKIHHDICRNDNIKLLEYHAKNVGIRRARSPWILSTNADAATGLDTANRFYGADLDPGVAWTAERVDIPWREGAQREISLIGSLRYRRVIPYEQLGTGDLCLASRALWHGIRGYDERMVRHRIGCDVRGTAQMLAHGAKIRRAGTVLHLVHPTSCTEGIQPHHGEAAQMEGIPYVNSDAWGLASQREVPLAERVWRLE